MSSEKEKDEYNVISDNNEYAVESNGEEIMYEEYIDADQIIEGYTEDGEVIYYTEDGVYEEIILGDDSDILYEEIAYAGDNQEKADDVVFIEPEKESEEVILGDNFDEDKDEKKNVSKKIENSDSKKKLKDKDGKNKEKSKSSKNDGKEKAVLGKKSTNNDEIVKNDVENKSVVKSNGVSPDSVDINSNSNNINISKNSDLNKIVQSSDTNSVLNKDLNENLQSNNVVVKQSNNEIKNVQQNSDIANTNNDINNVVTNTVSENNSSSDTIVNNSSVQTNDRVKNVEQNNNVVNNSTYNNVTNNNTNNNINNSINNTSSNVMSANVLTNGTVVNSSGEQLNNRQNNSVFKSVFTQEEKASLVSDENARLANGQNLVENNMGNLKSVPVVEINLENSNSSLNQNNNVLNNVSYSGSTMMVSNQSMSNGAYQMSGQVNNPNMMTQAPMMYQNQMVPGQNQMPTMQPMNNYMNPNQGVVVQPQIINSQPMPYQSPVMNQPYQSVIPVATSGVVPPSNMNYQNNAQQMMQPVNTQMMYQANYAAPGVQQMGQPVYPNNVMPQVPRVNPYQAMKPATQTNKASTSSNKSIYKKNHGFLKFLFTLLFLAIVGFAVYILFFRESNYTGKANLNSLFDPLKPIPVYDGELLGYVNYKGEVLIEPYYNSGSDFYGEFAIVSKDEKYIIINKAGDSVINVKTSSIPFYDSRYDVWIVDNNLYDNEMNTLFSNIKDISNGFYSYVDSNKGEVGIVNNTGKVLYSSPGTTISFETTETFFNDVYALVKIDGSDDVIISGTTGDIVYKSLGMNIKDDNIFSVNFNGVTKYIYVFDGKVVKEFDNVSDVCVFNFSKKILQVTNLDGSNYYYDTINNAELTAAEADDLFYAEEYYGYKIVKKESESGVKYDLTKDGESVLDMTYDSITFLEPELHEFVKIRTLKEFVILVNGDTVELYDLTFKKVFVELQNVEVIHGGTFVIFKAMSDSSNKEDTVYNLLTNMQTKFTTGEKEYIVGSNYVVAVDKNNNAAYYNIKVENIHETSNFSR